MTGRNHSARSSECHFVSRGSLGEQRLSLPCPQVLRKEPPPRPHTLTATPLQPFAVEQLTLAALFMCTWAFLEVPLPLALPMLLFLHMPALLVVEAHAWLPAACKLQQHQHQLCTAIMASCEGEECAGCSSSSGPAMLAGAWQCDWRSIALSSAFLRRGGLLLLTSCAAAVLAQLLLNGHRVATAAHSSITGAECAAGGAQPGASPLPGLHQPPGAGSSGAGSSGGLRKVEQPGGASQLWQAWGGLGAAVGRWAARTPVLRALYRPVRLRMGGWATEWEAELMSRLLGLRLAHLVVPAVCVPVVAYTIAMCVGARGQRVLSACV
jgi:hypothetical protein